MRRLVGALALLLVLAGCTSPAAEGEPLADAGSMEADANASSAVAPDGRGELAARNETSALEEGAGGGEHAHDLWAGRGRVMLADTHVLFRACCHPETKVISEPFRLDEGALVFEGTGHVEVTLSEPQRTACTNLWVSGTRLCTDEAAPLDDPGGGPAGIRLLVQDARSDGFRDAGEVRWGEPLVVPITDPRETDMPHSSSTLWRFRFEATDAALEGYRGRVTVEIVRAEGEDIPVWPGHPDFYASGPDRVVLVKPGAKTSEDGITTLVEPQPFAPHVPEKLVSWGTRSVHVWANVTDVKTDNPALTPGQWTLGYHNATGALRFHKTEFPGDARELHWTIEVTDDGMDNPYASKSRWGFLLTGIFFVGHDGVGWFSCTGFCASYEVTYDLVVHASATALPAEEE